ncbi:MAG TPA: TonB-dependent receptor [Casimicrobiaceae bacterium]|nr:TonB-dependent receptor [Casimicrobiaceae bacterium]
MFAAASAPAGAANPAEALEALKVEVIGTTPLPGLGTPLADVPANVQMFGQRDLSRQPFQNIAGFLDRGAASVGIGSAQGNAYQQDLSFRGFAASPLLGTPQGVSVFQDGVRINEAFGDVVNWDLLPQSAISSVQLIPGSNPVFGLNTLGGALALYTKSGAQYPGASLEATAGSFGRRSAALAYGGSRQRLDYFVTADAADDRGWAEHNASRLRRLFGKVGYQDERSDLDVSLTLAGNTLAGAQTLPVSFLDTPRQAYTFPDSNRNRVSMLAAKGSRFIDETTLFGGDVYLRRYRNDNFSSNVNDDFGTIDPETGVAATNEATNDRSEIDQRSWGVGAQVTLQRRLAGRAHQLVVGASIDGGTARFRQQSQSATFTADRATVATGDFVAQTDVATTNRYLGVFAADTLALADAWTLSLAGRYNHATIGIADSSGNAPGLDGRHIFARFAPAIGINFKPSQALTAYAAYNEGMRAPSPVELTCADATAPCKLPNIFIADPPLKKVVSRTIEAGARGHRDAFDWSAAAYRTGLDDDIQFIASGKGAINAGYFQNVGRTRRQGIELGATARLGAVELALRYSHIDATFRSAFVAASPNNSSADAGGAIRVQPGDRIPGIPADSLKLRADLDFDARWTIGGNLVLASSQYARGDENNRDAGGRVPGYAVVDVDARGRLTRTLQLVVGSSNVFDRRYQNFGILGANVFNGPDRSFGPALGIEPSREQFRAVGAPRTLWIALEYSPDARLDR